VKTTSAHIAERREGSAGSHHEARVSRLLRVEYTITTTGWLFLIYDILLTEPERSVNVPRTRFTCITTQT